MSSQYTDPQLQIKLSHAAAQGDKAARIQVNELADPMIQFQTNRYCKRFCKENYLRYQCSLPKVLKLLPKGSILCEWGNASYVWMLNDLTKETRLLKYEARNGASLFDYFYQIANSLPFYERWKDWRFGRRVHIPEYIKQISPYAAQIFLALRASDNAEKISQNIKTSLHNIESICQEIIVELTRRKRLYLLNPPATTTLTSTDDEGGQQQDVAFYDESAELQQQKQQLKTAWAALDASEQFVIEAMLMDEQDAEDVLYALKKLNISIKKDVPAEQTNIQQLYYFRRKTLSKLAKHFS